MADHTPRRYLDDPRSWPLFTSVSGGDLPEDLAVLVMEFERVGQESWQGLVEAAAAALASTLTDGPLRSWQRLLLVAHGPWQPPSAVVRHRRLWASVEPFASSPVLPSRGPEIEVTSSKGVRFAGLVQLASQEDLAVAVELMRSEDTAAIWLRPDHLADRRAALDEIFAAAFPSDDGSPSTALDWRSLAEFASRRGEVVLRASGTFDDPALHIDVFGPRKQVQSLMA